MADQLPWIAGLAGDDIGVVCPFCGRDPYHYVDVGVGWVPAAVECCELGIALFQYGDEQLSEVSGRILDAAQWIASRADIHAAELAAAKAEVARLRDALRHVHETLWEINPNNYDHDEVCRLNDASVEAILFIAPLIGETHGKSPEWWAAHTAASGGKLGDGKE